MSPDWDEKAVFLQARALAGVQRAEFLASMCPDKERRDRIESLLSKAENAPQGFLEGGSPLKRDPVEVPHMIAEFRILRQLGRGGMGVVYLAEDTVLRREVALKVLSESAISASLLIRFQTEAQAAAKLSHSGIVDIYSVGQDAGQHFIAMEYVAGTTLSTWVSDGTGALKREALTGLAEASTASLRPPTAYVGESLPKTLPANRIPTAVRIVEAVADALDHAHKRGVIHRDVKPSNILIDTAGHAHLSDFGIARITEDPSVTRIGELTGTVQYMSPEQASAAGFPVDHRSDIFSLGVVLYELLTLRRPFDRASSGDTLHAIQTIDPPKLRSINPAVPRDLETVCHKVLEKDPKNRYPSAAHLAAELRCVLRGEPILARPPSMWRQGRHWVRLHHRAAQISLTLCISVVALWMAWREWDRRTSSRAALSIRAAQANHGDATASLLAWDQKTQSFQRPRVIGALPINRFSVDPGLYRIAINDSLGRTCDFDEYCVAGEHVVRIVQTLDIRKAPDGMVRFEGGVMPVRYFDPTTGDLVTKTPSLDPFWIDVAEVTNAQFRTFVDATGGTPPRIWSELVESEIADRPVVDLTREQMQAYALWVGKRLPSLDEWLAAAQAPDGRVVPWGDSAPFDECVPTRDMLTAAQDIEPSRLSKYYRAFVRPSDKATPSTTGLLHVFGNVLEMTGTQRADPRGVVAVVAGGYWASDPQSTDLRKVQAYPPNGKSTQIGFRCARSAAAASSTR